MTSSCIVNVNGRFVESARTLYELGDPDPAYLKWMQENSVPFDPENPVTIHKTVDTMWRPGSK